MNWPISKKVLILVKTYPTLSSKYDELVCTAWITEYWEWIRIYPMQFRKFNETQQYKKYDWIDIELLRNENDPRPETYRPYVVPPIFDITSHISAEDSWRERKELVLNNVFTNLSKLISENKDKSIWTSLAIFKPTEVVDFIIEECEREWNPEKVKDIMAKSKQMNILEEVEVFNLVPKVPYCFKYKFIDDEGTTSTLMIEDWEIWALYWNCLREYGDEKLACEKIRDKYLTEFITKKDLYFFLGTTRQFNGWSHNPFIIIWTFYPPKDERIRLF